MKYSDKLKDPRWQKKRLAILERDSWMCRFCREKKETLHIHHVGYFPRIEPWDVPGGFLITLCESCHKNCYENGYIEKEIIGLMSAVLESAFFQNNKDFHKNAYNYIHK